MQKTVIITAGGSGERMDNSTPKQFILLNNQPIIFHTIKKFYDYDKNIEIIISLKKEYFILWYELIEKHNFIIKCKLVEGGDTRYQSVKNALNNIIDSNIIAIHDSVRPLIDVSLISRTFDKASEVGAAIPVVDLKDSIREISSSSSKSVGRANYKLVQTPQIFKTKIITNAYSLQYDENITDDAGLVEKAGNIVYLVEGDARNIKITEPSDLLIAEALIKTFTN